MTCPVSEQGAASKGLSDAFEVTWILDYHVQIQLQILRNRFEATHER